MDSWVTTLRLLAVMAAIVVFYILGRWVGEMLHTFAASGSLPTP
jgi:type III secretory pathway component EscS